MYLRQPDGTEISTSPGDEAVKALGKMGKAALSTLTALLRDEDGGVRRTAARALGELGDRRAVEPLTAVLRDRDADVREAAASALRQIGDPRLVERLIHKLKSASAGSRQEAAVALGELGDARAADALAVALKDERGSVRVAAARALGQIGDARAVDPTIAMLNLQDKPLYELVALVIEAESVWDLAYLSSGLFNGATTEELERLVDHPHCGVALLAGWERVRRTVPREEPLNSVVDKMALARFLELVEKRTQVTLPGFWEGAVQSARSHRRSNIYFPKRERTDGVSEVKRRGDLWVVTADGETWFLPGAGPLSPWGRGGEASVELTNKRAYFAIYDDTAPSPCTLYAVERSSGEVSWSAEAWTGGGLMDSAGWGGSHDAKLQVRGDEVIVFGVTDGAAYIEVFDTKTGWNLWRFSTGYFNW